MNLKPIVKWAGGKSWLIPYLEPYAETIASSRLVELFAGGAALSWWFHPQEAFWCDTNEHLCALYEFVRWGNAWYMPMLKSEELYYLYRDMLNATKGTYPPEVIGQVFYYLNKYGFNGLCRYNKKGKFNVPYGDMAQIPAPDFVDHTTFLQQVRIFRGDYRTGLAMLDVVPESDKQNILFVDPPYVDAFTGYQAQGWSMDDQHNLMQELSTGTDWVIATNHATPEMIQMHLMHGFTVYQFAAPRRISSSGDRTPVMELVAFRHMPDDVRMTWEQTHGPGLRIA